MGEPAHQERARQRRRERQRERERDARAAAAAVLAMEELNALRRLLYTDCWNMQFQEFCLSVDRTVDQSKPLLLREELIEGKVALDETENRVFGLCEAALWLAEEREDCDVSAAVRRNVSRMYFGGRKNENLQKKTLLEAQLDYDIPALLSLDNMRSSLSSSARERERERERVCVCVCAFSCAF